MNWEEAANAVADARRTLDAADHIANDIARILVGRLHRVSAYQLRALKRELRKFNIHTGSWSDE